MTHAPPFSIGRKAPDDSNSPGPRRRPWRRVQLRDRRTAWGPAARRAFLGVAVVGILGAYSPNLFELVRTWRDQPDYSHGFLIIPVALAIFWRYRRHVGFAPNPSRGDWVFLGVVLAVRAASHESGEFWIETATFPAAVAALVVAYGGWSLLRRTWPAVAYLMFMLTVPASIDAKISIPLQGLAAKASGEVLRMMGFWVLNEGNTLIFDSERLEVATACNGLAMLMSLSATVVAMVLLVPMERWKRASLLLGVVPIAIACNIFRIVLTTWCYKHLGTESGRGFAHDAAGWLMMPMALAMVWLVLRWLSLLFSGTADSEPVGRCANSRNAHPTTRAII